MVALSPRSGSADLIAFPGVPAGNAGGAIAAALKAHRLPELLAARLLRAAGPSPDPETALADALAAHMTLEPLKLERAQSILLIGASGAGKSTASAAIAAAAAPRETLQLQARDGLAFLRGGVLPSQALVVMEADGFHPLNPKARGAFAALSDIEAIEAIGVVSGAGDAADVAEMIAAFRFKRIIVTGLDRTRRLGALVAAAMGGARLSHVVRDGKLETPTFRALAAALLAPRPHS
jgi:hypothetical protein